MRMEAAVVVWQMFPPKLQRASRFRTGYLLVSRGFMLFAFDARDFGDNYLAALAQRLYRG